MRLALLTLCLAFAACSHRPSVVAGEYLGPTGPGPKVIGEPTSQQIAELQLYVIPFSRKVRELPGFSDLYIDHEPRWQVVVAFTRPLSRRQVASLAPAAIRDRIIIRSAKRTQAQIVADLDATAAALRGAGTDFTGGYDPRSQRFKITVGNPAHVRPVQSALPPHVRSDTDVSVGPLPVPE